MAYRIAFIIYLLFTVSFGTGCDHPVALPEEDEEAAPQTVVPYTEGIRIAWDARTRQRVFDGPASYPRMIRLQNGNLLASVESRGGSYALISRDDGNSWSDPKQVAAPQDSIIAAAPSLLKLKNGTVLLAYNTRPPMDNAQASRRFGIKVKASTDGGHTWEERSTVLKAGVESSRGVWEPAMIQLPSGEIQLFVANEYPYPDSDDQEISMFRSTDQGMTWSDFETISYRVGHRDGMPAPRQLNGDNGIAVAIEDNGIGGGGDFKPAIVWTESVEDAWASGPIRGTSERRWRALSEEARLPATVYGGAPYLVQFSSGETLLSFQSNKGRSGDWQQSTMVVSIGSEEAKAFSRLSYPFDVPAGRRALWNSLFIKDERTVTALTATTAYNPSHQEFYIIDGYRIPEPHVSKGEVAVDGNASEEVWSKATTMQAGAYTDKVVEAKMAWSEKHLYVLFHVYDGWTKSTDGLSEDDDAVWLSLATDKLSEDGLVQGAYRVRVEAGGDHTLAASEEGEWDSISDDSGVRVQVSDPSPYTSDAFSGKVYLIEVGIPWEQVGGQPPVGQGWGVNIGLVNAGAQGGSVTRESIAGNRPQRPGTWSKSTLVD